MYPRYSELSDADKANDWKADISQKEYSEAKGARKEMLAQLAQRQHPHTHHAQSVSRAASKHEHRVKAGRKMGKAPRYSRPQHPAIAA